MAYTEDHYIKVADITDVEKTVWQVASKVSTDYMFFKEECLHSIMQYPMLLIISITNNV